MQLNRYIKAAIQRFNCEFDFLSYSHYSKQYIKKIISDNSAATGSLLIVSGRGMNVLWAQVWCIYSLVIQRSGFKIYVLTTRQQKGLNKYFKLFKIHLIYLEDFSEKYISAPLPAEIQDVLNRATQFEEFKAIQFKGVPLGEIALSTYTRYHGTGKINLEDTKIVDWIKDWISILYKAILSCEDIYCLYKITMCFFAEIFFEEYGAFYYTAIQKGLNIIKFTGTVRDNAIILQHLDRTNDRQHHASLSQQSWQRIKQRPLTETMQQELLQNFQDRYSGKWYRSQRNHAKTKFFEPKTVRAMLGVASDRKIAVVFSHILYDTLFMFGTDLYAEYAEWLVETTNAACQNNKIEWFIKVHPSNNWRGEMHSILKGRYEEERLIEERVGTLPSHVHIIPADTPINPYSLFNAIDFCVTVRGTTGLEMAALGKPVITAGTGRYEGCGFTTDSSTKEDYVNRLKQLPEIGVSSKELAQKYAYGLFICKPFEMNSFKPQLRHGVTMFIASDDLVYYPRKLINNDLHTDLKVFQKWALNTEQKELIVNG